MANIAIPIALVFKFMLFNKPYNFISINANYLFKSIYNLNFTIVKFVF